LRFQATHLNFLWCTFTAIAGALDSTWRKLCLRHLPQFEFKDCGKARITALRLHIRKIPSENPKAIAAELLKPRPCALFAKRRDALCHKESPVKKSINYLAHCKENRIPSPAKKREFGISRKP
jgi:hypothetical protein